MFLCRGNCEAHSGRHQTACERNLPINLSYCCLFGEVKSNDPCSTIQPPFLQEILYLFTFLGIFTADNPVQLDLGPKLQEFVAVSDAVVLFLTD